MAALMLPHGGATALRVGRRLVAGAGVLLMLGGVITAIGGGVAFHIGPVPISAKDPARLLMEGALLALLALTVQMADRTRRQVACYALLLLVYFGALAGGSSARRVGDGQEYLAMAFQLAHGRLPAVTAADAVEFTTRQRERSGIAGVLDLDVAAGRPEARREFVHFWLYPLVVAPALRLADALGVGWNSAFTVVNTCLLLALGLVAVRRLPPIGALAVVLGPVVWWIDKAHVEVFIYTLLGMATVLLRDRPHWSLMLLGALAAQNPAFGVVLLPLIAWTLASTHARRRTIGVSAAALALAACHPLYYVVRTGQPFPLTGTLDWSVPSLTAIASPLIDPLSGILWYLPWPFVLPLLIRRTPGHRLPLRACVTLSISAVALLVLCAMSGNVNHGATPGPSRYGVWLVPLVLAWLVGGMEPTAWRRLAVVATASVSVVHATWAFHPKVGEDATHTTPLAAWILDAAPAVYDPLPEVFAERFGRVDGPAHLPVATPGCGKVLLAGGATPTRWPFPCVPAQVPPWCTHGNALCYANRTSRGGYAFSMPPRQRSFSIGRPTDGPTWSSTEDLRPLPLDVDWRGLRYVAPTSKTSVIREARDVRRIWAYQGPGILVAFVRPLTDRPPAVRLGAGVGCGWWWSPNGLSPDAAFTAMPGAWTTAPLAAEVILVAASACSAGR